MSSPDPLQDEIRDADYYGLDDEERYGERTIYTDRETGEEYYYSPNGDKYYLEAE